MKPLDFFIGIREFFSRFVPGIVFLYLFPPAASLFGAQASGIGLLILAIAAYLAGSVAAGLGGALDWLTDTLLAQRWFRRLFAPSLAGREAQAKALRDRLLSKVTGSAAEKKDSPKAFWWDYLRLNCPIALAELERIEAGQKMFRSLIAVFFFLGLYGLAKPVQAVGMPAAVPVAILFLFALASVPFYVGGRLAFLQAVCRLAIAYSAGPASKREAE